MNLIVVCVRIVVDLSPGLLIPFSHLNRYVRKCAANAIPKIYSVDKEQEEPLVALIERLLKDSTCMVRDFQR